MKTIGMSLLLTLCCCSKQNRNQLIPPDAPTVISDDFRREHDPRFSKQEQLIVTAARRHLESAAHKPVDAYFNIKHTGVGYDVFVEFVSGYDRSEPHFSAGGHCTVQLRDDGSVVRVIPGE